MILGHSALFTFLSFRRLSVSEYSVVTQDRKTALKERVRWYRLHFGAKYQAVQLSVFSLLSCHLLAHVFWLAIRVPALS